MIDRLGKQLRADRRWLASSMSILVEEREKAEGPKKAQLRAVGIEVEHAIRRLDNALTKLGVRNS